MLLLNPQTEPSKTVTLVGVADYLNPQSTDYVVIKVETGLDNDYFVGFNRATGVNADNDEGDDVITVVQVDGQNGEEFTQSYLKAKLGFNGDITGSSYTITDFGGTGFPLTISAFSIDLKSNPAKANVRFLYEGGDGGGGGDDGGGGGTGERSGGDKIAGIKGYIKIDGKCLSRTNEGNAVFWKCYGGNNQKWRYNGTTKEFNNIKNMDGEKPCLHQNANKGKVVVKNCSGFLNQQWYIEETRSGDRMMIRSVLDDKCLYNNLSNNARTQDNCNFFPNQSFDFVPV